MAPRGPDPGVRCAGDDPRRPPGEGLLPSFAALSANGITYPLENDVQYLPDTLWTDVISGRSSAAAGVYWQPEQVHVGRLGCDRTRSTISG
jgi:hypothetical protein